MKCTCLTKAYQRLTASFSFPLKPNVQSWHLPGSPPMGTLDWTLGAEYFAVSYPCCD